MKKSKKNLLDFSKKSIVELNREEMYKLVGGTSDFSIAGSDTIIIHDPVTNDDSTINVTNAATFTQTSGKETFSTNCSMLCP